MRFVWSDRGCDVRPRREYRRASPGRRQRVSRTLRWYYRERDFTTDPVDERGPPVRATHGSHWGCLLGSHKWLSAPRSQPQYSRFRPECDLGVYTAPRSVLLPTTLITKVVIHHIHLGQRLRQLTASPRPHSRPPGAVTRPLSRVGPSAETRGYTGYTGWCGVAHGGLYLRIT